MARWEPNAGGRLREAALELFLERGYEQTTVADIAERAGLTARTFFRHFADKREVLFADGAALEHLLSDRLAAAPPGTPPLVAVAGAVGALTEVIGDDRPRSQTRQA